MNQQYSKTIPHLSASLIICIISCFTTYGNAATPDITTGELLIKLTPDAYVDFQSLHSRSAITSLFTKHNVLSQKPIFPTSTSSANLRRTYLLRFSITVDLQTLKTAFEESDLIEEVCYNYLRSTLADTFVPNDPQYPEQWSLPLMKLPETWTIEKGNTSVIIAIIDSGIDYRHEDLKQKIWNNPDEIPENGLDDDGNGYIDDIHGWDFTDAPNVQAVGDFLDGDNEPLDESGHGTHVAGIAGAMPNNGIGIAGVAWNCPLMAVRAGLSLGSSSRMQDDDSAAAIVYATDNGASIINMSWGSGQHSFVIQDAIDYAHAHGVVMIGAAGNSKESESFYPAAYRKVISVASTTQHKQRFHRSNFGASVDIAAPGNAILSTQINNKYRILTGTSMAAPHVAGVAALMLSKRPALTHEEVRQILINTSDVVTQEDTDEPDPKLVGAGTVNAERALLSSGVLQARIHKPQTNSGGSTSITFTGTATGYKFEQWQMFYGSSSVPTSFTPFTDPNSTPKTFEHLVVWDTTTIPEDVYTVRLVVTGGDGEQTHDQVVVTVDRSPPKFISITANEALYGNSSTTIFTWATDDITRCSLYYRHSDRNSPFATIEEREIGKEHLFSLDLTQGQYQFYFSALNTVGLKTIDDNNGKYYTIDVAGSAISPNGYVETSLGMSSLHIANTVTDFDKDGLPEFVATPLSDSSSNGLIIPNSLVIYERTQSGKYVPAHTLTQNINVVDSVESQNSGIDLDTFTPWAVDDTDNDGLMEVLASDKERTFLIESTKPNGYPTHIVWETPFISGGESADLDGDGKIEIVGVDNNNNRILIFENIGNNNFDRTVELTNESDGKNIFTQQIVINDFNSDSNVDMVFGDSEGELFVYTAIANDSFNLQWQKQLNIDDVKLLTSGDLTRDGKPELVVGGTLSPPGLSAASPIWKFLIYTYISGKYRLLWEQAIAPYRLNGNSIAIADVNGDKYNELIINTFPNLYIMEWDRNTFIPSYYKQVSETPALFTADLNNNSFDELYINVDERLSIIESATATNSNAVDALIPWGVTATPITDKVVQVQWEAIETTKAQTVFTVYRALGEKQKEPSDSKFEIIKQDFTSTRYLDRTVKTDKTYWYAVTAKEENGIETDRSESVSATPRSAPKIMKTNYHPPNWIIVTFDRQMSSNISDERRYLLREVSQLEGLIPMSAIRDRTGTRALLTFNTEKIQALTTAPTSQYEIAINNISDIDKNQIRAVTSPVELQQNSIISEVKDFNQLRVYPNPVRPNIADKGAITFDRVPTGTHIQLFTPKGELLENLNVTENDGNSKEWWLTNATIGDVATGIYIYILEYDAQKKVGKIAVIK